jgi:DHA2 family multidrug resistance protein
VVFVTPGFLGAVAGYRALETGRVLTWTLLPLLLAGTLGALLMRRIDGRVVLATGLALVGASALWNSLVTGAWVAQDFHASQILVGAGLAFTLVGQIGLIGQQVRASGAIERPVDVLTFAAFFQVVRLFGGQVGVAVMQRFVAQREFFHSNLLGYNLQVGDFVTEERLRALTLGLLSASEGIEEAQARAVTLLGAQVRGQAYTLAYGDAFILLALVCLAFMLVLALMKPMPIYYDSTVADLP